MDVKYTDVTTEYLKFRKWCWNKHLNGIVLKNKNTIMFRVIYENYDGSYQLVYKFNSKTDKQPLTIQKIVIEYFMNVLWLQTKDIKYAKT